jgi:hypothetical protein
MDKDRRLETQLAGLSLLPKGDCPKSPDEMAPDVLYVPQDPSYPFVEAHFKRKGKVHGIQR